MPLVQASIELLFVRTGLECRAFSTARTSVLPPVSKVLYDGRVREREGYLPEHAWVQCFGHRQLSCAGALQGESNAGGLPAESLTKRLRSILR